MPKLVVAIDGVVLKEVVLAKESTTIGRRPYNDIVIDNLAVSGEHAQVRMTSGEVTLEDLDSTNGTYVNAHAVRLQKLEFGDVVEIGKYHIHFLATEDSASQVLTTQPIEPTKTMPLPLGATAPAPLGDGLSLAEIRILSGVGTGRVISLHKVVTTIGKPGVAVAAITRRLQGYVVAPVDGRALLNDEALPVEAVALQDGDVLELGGARMQFVHN